MHIAAGQGSRSGSRRRIPAAAAGAALLALVSGCASIKDHRGYFADPTMMSAIQPGIDNRQSVERTLGHPTFASQFGDPAWYYVSVDTKQPAFGTPRTSAETVLKITFDPAGNVAHVEKTGAERVVRLSPESHKTPTLGRERGFLEDLFGNIGAVGAAGAGTSANRGPPGS
jgi:outer membrane protein assembly factor BamE (lipoprotein component of BamABCDE complex)